MSSRKSKLSAILFRASLRFKTGWYSSFRHKAEIDPYRVIWIDPILISDRNKAFVPVGILYCQVLEGDWDLTGKKFEDTGVFKLIRDHFLYDIPWVETETYQRRLKTLLETGRCKSWKECRTESDLLARCAFLDQLYGSIKENGYLLPKGISYGKSGVCTSRDPLEIAVNVGRDGKFIFWDGGHRLSIAKILGHPLIPVRVVIRHRLWQEIRDRIIKGVRKNDLPVELEPYILHQDISYLLAQ